MTKEQWIRHLESVSGLLRPSDENGAMSDDWKRAYAIHKANDPKCTECAARRRTKRAAANAKAIRQTYADCGMRRVRGALGGVYYE